MKHRIGLLAILLLCVVCLCACGSKSSSASDDEGTDMSVSTPAQGGVTEVETETTESAEELYSRRWEEYGQLERERMDVSADAAIAVQADHFAISQQEVSALAGEYQLFRNYQADEAREKALEQLIEEYAVYTYATAQGYEADEAALDAMVADARDAEEMSEDERQSFLQSFDGDEELYWSLYREDMRMYQTIDDFQDDYRSTYDGSSDFYEAWLALVDEIVAGEHAQVL
jgi:hypothetical protein